MANSLFVCGKPFGGLPRRFLLPIFLLASIPIMPNALEAIALLIPVLRGSSQGWAQEVPSNSDVLPPLPSSTPETAGAELPMMEQSLQLDPLNSPYPVPWNWVMTMLSESQSLNEPTVRYYRSPSLISPDGRYAAYSRIQMQVQPDFTQSRIGSVLFLENLETGDLRTITAASPFADNPFMPGSEPELGGTIAILIPIAWSESGDRILAREFESLFGTDIASDYAVIWNRDAGKTQTVAPTQVQYTNAVLLGWSHSNPDQVLFRAGNLGDETWPLWAVNNNGRTIAAVDDEPVIYGQIVNNIWTGPQAYQH
jgi:hypothetical protein